MSGIRVRASRCLLAALVTMTAACAADAPRQNSAPQPLDELRIGSFGSEQSVRGLVPLFSAEPLITVEWDGTPVFRIAESATSAEDGTSLTLRLRSNVKFHNGEKVTAEAVAKLMSEPLRRRGISAISADDELTLTLKFAQPFGFRPETLSDVRLQDEINLQLRTGPFKVVSSDPPVLEGFADYYQGSPFVRRVTIKRYPSQRAALTAMMRGEVNFLHEVSREAIEFVQAGGDFQTYPLLRPYVIPLVFNLRHPILAKREVRVALNEAIDREEVVRNGMRGHGQVAEGPYWPFLSTYTRGRYPSPYNPEAAKVRLDAAGFPVKRSGAEQPPSRFRFTCLVPAGDSRFERIALVVQRQLLAVGVDMDLRPTTQLESNKSVKSRDFEAIIFEMVTGRTLDWPTVFWQSKNPYFDHGYSTADRALARLQHARSSDEARLAVSEVMSHLRDDPPAIFLALPREARAADKAFYIPYETDRDVLGTLWQLRPIQRASAARR
jgi:peptide/nickel transport system substrate-binding protein